MKKMLHIKKYILAHKVLSGIAAIVIVGAGYFSYKKIFPTVVVPQYTLSPARIGSIMQTVTGTGQVSAENQLDVTSEVSGKIISIQAKVGQHVHKGDLIATLDAHDALVSLENARIAYAKLTQPAKIGDLTNAQNNVSKARNDAMTAISNAFLDIPSIMSGLNDMLYGGRTGYLSSGQTTNLTMTGKNYQYAAIQSYDKASNGYSDALQAYKNLTAASSQSDIEEVLTSTYDFMKKLSDALKTTQSAITFIAISQPDYDPSGATSAASSVTTWSGQVNGDLSSLLSAKNSIASSIDSLDKLNEGADALDVQSQQLSLEQAERTYQKYFIRAPFEGVIGKIPVSVYGQAGASTAIATLVGDQKIAAISLNEVDAAKVSAGQAVTVTFDAIDGINATGTVQEVDQVGAVTQGVVSYGVKIAIATSDPRIKPGMSVNTTIITNKKDNVLVVPTAAVKTLGKTKYVQVLDTATTTTRRTFTGGISMGFTVPSSVPPKQVTVTIGDSDDTNTEILSGLNPGQLVVIKTSTGTTGTAAAAPNILSSIGGNRGGAGGGAVRTNATFAR